ncbi:MAG: T9SS type A sorting domain-containing protein [Bacteroidia bacterium]|nr:T9SS type A sorting domain-containing protein [Bacteroidia bacterium]
MKTKVLFQTKKQLLLLVVQCVFVSSFFAQGFTWQDYTSPTTIYSAVFEGNYMWITTSGGVIKFDTVTKNREYFNPYNSGLPCNNVFSVAIDNANNKWFGTGGGASGYYEATGAGRGLAKYNGSTWTVYNTSNSGLPNNSVRCVYVDNSNDIWAGTNGGGMTKFNGTTWVTYKRTTSPLPSDTVSCIVNDNNGLKWIATFRGVASFDGTTWTIYNKANSGLPGDTVRTIAIGPNNEKWIGTSRGVAKFNDTTWTTYTTLNSGLPYRNVIRILPEMDGTVWFATYGMAETYGSGLAKLVGTTWTTYSSSNSNLPRNNVSIILSDASGKLWVSSERGHKAGKGMGQMNRFDRNVLWETFEISDNELIDNFFYTMAKDQAGNLWFGGEKAGVTKFDGTVWTNYNIENSSLADDDNYSIKFDNNGDLWTSHDRGRISKYNGGTSYTTLSTPNGISDDPFTIAFDSSNNLWAGCRGTGVLKYNGSMWTNFTTSNSGLPHNYVNHIKIDNADNLWISTNNGLALFDGTTWTVYNTSNSGLPFNQVSHVEIDQANNKWISTFGGLAKFDGTTWTVYKTNNSGISNNKVYCVAIDANNVKWIGTWTGACKLDGTTWTTLTNFSGAPYQYVKDIGFDNNGNTWLMTQGQGLVVYIPDVSTSLNQSNIHHETIYNYPNPVSDETVISFASHTADSFVLKVVDISGREISLNYTYTINNGIHIFKLSPNKLTQGIYFYSVISKSESKSGKMLVLSSGY